MISFIKKLIFQKRCNRSEIFRYVYPMNMQHKIVIISRLSIVFQIIANCVDYTAKRVIFPCFSPSFYLDLSLSLYVLNTLLSLPNSTCPARLSTIEMSLPIFLSSYNSVLHSSLLLFSPFPLFSSLSSLFYSLLLLIYRLPVIVFPSHSPSFPWLHMSSLFSLSLSPK